MGREEGEREGGRVRGEGVRWRRENRDRVERDLSWSQFHEAAKNSWRGAEREGRGKEGEGEGDREREREREGEREEE